MIRRAIGVSMLAVTFVPVAGATSPCAAAAPGTHRAGMVVEFGDHTSKDFCVAFNEASITGYELLRRSGLPVKIQDYGGGNLTVCQIDGKGCDYPRRPCFCECVNANKGCRFWGYYRIVGATGAWKFSDVGPGATAVHDGDIEGWRWGEQGPRGGAPPAGTSLAKVCENGVHIAAPITTAPKGPNPVALTAFGTLLLGLFMFASQRARRKRDAI